MKKLSELTNKQKVLIVIAVLVIIVIVLTLALTKLNVFGEKSKSNVFENESVSNNIKKSEIKIEDRCEITAQVLETFYSDENYDYQFSSAKSGCMYVIVDNKEYLVTEALANKIITIEEAEQAGLEFYKESKESIDNNLRIEDRCEVTAQAIETFYSDDKYDYQFSSIKSGCTYAILNNQEYPIKEALENKIITIEDAEQSGLKFTKVEKKTTTSSNPSTSTTKTIKIEDKCDITAQAIETFYSDDKYDYQFSSIKSGCVYAVVNNKRYTINDALNKNIITIEEAEKAGLKFAKVSKNTTSNKTISIEDKCCKDCDSIQEIETFYSDSNYNYMFPVPMSSCIYANVNGTSYPIKDALNKNIITIEEAEKAGLSFYKEAKENYEIRNTCDVYLETVEEFYSDDYYIYSFSSTLSGCLYVEIGVTDYLVVDAVRYGLITVEDIENAGIYIIKTKK